MRTENHVISIVWYALILSWSDVFSTLTRLFRLIHPQTVVTNEARGRGERREERGERWGDWAVYRPWPDCNLVMRTLMNFNQLLFVLHLTPDHFWLLRILVNYCECCLLTMATGATLCCTNVVKSNIGSLTVCWVSLIYLLILIISETAPPVLMERGGYPSNIIENLQYNTNIGPFPDENVFFPHLYSQNWKIILSEIFRRSHRDVFENWLKMWMFVPL